MPDFVEFERTCMYVWSMQERVIVEMRTDIRTEALKDWKECRLSGDANRSRRRNPNRETPKL